MGNACSCLQSPTDLSLKNVEVEYLGSNETNLDYEAIQTNIAKLPNFKLLKRVAKKFLVSKYIMTLKDSSSFSVPYEKFKQKFSLIETEAVQINEEEYGEYRIVPVFGEYTINLPSIYQYQTYLYQGEWHFFTKNPHGSGTSYCLSAHEKYSGNFKDGEKSGLGRLIFPNGDMYEGEFANGEMNGMGTYLHFQGKVYIGEFKKGLKDGFGKEQDRHESCYEGEFHKGKRYGNGKIIWEDGGFFQGQFVDDKACGVGERYWPGDKKYYGQWIDDKMHGEGECVWEDGRKYKGMYFKGLENGKGTMEFPDGSIYTGAFKNGKQTGIGRLTYPDHNVKKGVWENNNFLSSIIE